VPVQLLILVQLLVLVSGCTQSCRLDADIMLAIRFSCCAVGASVVVAVVIAAVAAVVAAVAVVAVAVVAAAVVAVVAAAAAAVAVAAAAGAADVIVFAAAAAAVAGGQHPNVCFPQALLRVARLPRMSVKSTASVTPHLEQRLEQVQVHVSSGSVY
jgi:hypothetical protein